MKRLSIVIIVAGLFALVLSSAALATPPDDSRNQVSDWCETGIKLEPVATPFVVPQGNWTLLVLKAGSGPDQNATFANPVVGQSYVHPTGKDISHVILCEGQETTTTVPEVTTTVPEVTTTVPEVTTTVPEVTTTVPEVTTTVPEVTTTVPEVTTTVPVPTTDPPPTTTIPEVSTDIPDELPLTGGPLAMFGAVGGLLAILGGATLFGLDKMRNIG